MSEQVSERVSECVVSLHQQSLVVETTCMCMFIYKISMADEPT